MIAQASENFHTIVACRSLEKANSAISELKREETKGQLSPIKLDVTDEQSITEAATQVRQQFGRLDVLINNAGIASQHPNLKAQLQQCLDTNVVGPVLVSTAFRELLLQSPSPYSIYISSGLSSMTKTLDPTSGEHFALWKTYKISKAGVNMVAVQEAAEFRSTPLKVFAVCPGLVRSNLRGLSEQDITFGGQAGDPMVSGETILSVIEGKRNGDVGKLVHKDGVYPW